MAFAESAMAERPVTQGAVRFEIAADLRLPSGDHAREQVLLPLGFQRRQLLLDLRADQPRAVFHRGHDGGAVETHLGRKPGGLGTPIRAPAGARLLLPVRGLDVVGIGQQVLAFSPAHRIIDVKGDGHIVLPGDREGIADELARLLVGHVETEGPHGETQFVPGVSRRSDRLDHVADERLQLRLAERKTAGHRRRARIPGEAGHELKGQVSGFSGLCLFGPCCRGLVAASRNHGEKEDRDRASGQGKFLSVDGNTGS